MRMDRRGFLRGAVALSAAGTLARAGTGIARAGESARALGTGDWMAGLDAGRPLRTLTVPGAHDSGARYGGPWAECQNTTVAQQLASGIRSLGIRCRVFEGSYTIHHGAFYQRLDVDDVLSACRDFLAAHPSETVLMRVKHEYSEVSGAEFGALFADCLDRRGGARSSSSPTRRPPRARRAAGSSCSPTTADCRAESAGATPRSPTSRTTARPSRSRSTRGSRPGSGRRWPGRASSTPTS
ncbi:hypothetical protein GCM10018987_14060 [Streptomyces cremeus]